MSTDSRLLRLLSLLQARRDWPGGELAERLGVSPRTVRRDVGKLRALGYPVHATAGLAGYRLGPGTTLPPLLLDDDEAVAVAVGLRTAAGGTVAGIGETSVRALAKLEQILPARLRHRVGALGAATEPLPNAGPRVDPDTLTEIAVACRNHQRLRLDYRSRDGEESVRVTEPHRLVHTGRRWYLVAFDLERNDWRTFRVDRLGVRTPTGPRFTPRELPADLVANALTTSPYRYRGVFTLKVPIAVAAEHIPPTVGVLEAIDEGSCRFTVGADSLDLLVMSVGVSGFPFQVNEPPELAEHVLVVANRLYEAAGQRRKRATNPLAGPLPSGSDVAGLDAVTP